MTAHEPAWTAGRPGSLPSTPTTGRQWRIEFPPGQELLNANRRLHHFRHAAIARQLRADAYRLAKHHKIPRLERAQVDGIYEPPDRRRRDSSNWNPTYKAMVDGLVDAGVLEDDDHTRLVGPIPHIGDPHPKGRIVLVITELTPTTPAQEKT